MNKVVAKKALGQHFLNNNSVIEDIIDSCVGLKSRNVLEIGPGNLALTKRLVQEAKSVLALEKDESLKMGLEVLKQNNKNFNYIIGDALHNMPLSDVVEPRVLVSNLPYNVGTQIFLNYLLFANKNVGSFDYFVLMFQKEVANRIVAKEGERGYGRLSIISSLLAECEVLFDVDPSNFTPAPKVDSSVIYIKPLLKPRFEVDLGKLEKVTELAFNLRRKTIRNSLKSLNLDFDKLNINNQKRPEELSIEEFCKIANTFSV